RDPIIIPDAPPSTLPYSAGVRSGDHVFLSGQTGIDPATGQLVESDVAAQAEQMFKGLARVLAAAGLSLADAVKCNVYLTGIGDWRRRRAGDYGWAAHRYVCEHRWHRCCPQRAAAGVRARR